MYFTKEELCENYQTISMCIALAKYDELLNEFLNDDIDYINIRKKSLLVKRYFELVGISDVYFKTINVNYRDYSIEFYLLKSDKEIRKMLKEEEYKLKERMINAPTGDSADSYPVVIDCLFDNFNLMKECRNEIENVKINIR